MAFETEFQHPPESETLGLRCLASSESWRRQSFAATLGYVSFRLADYKTAILNQQKLLQLGASCSARGSIDEGVSPGKLHVISKCTLVNKTPS